MGEDQRITLCAEFFQRTALRLICQTAGEDSAGFCIQPRFAKVIPPAMEAGRIAITEGLHAALSSPQIEKHVRPHGTPA